MLKPTTKIKCFSNNEKKQNDSFKILSWNVNKKEVYEYLLSLQKKENIDTIFLQEAKLNKLNYCDFENNSYTFCPNIETKKNLYGLLTVSKYEQEKISENITPYKEIFLTTHKAYLITRQFICKNEILLVNLHLLNFVPFTLFKMQLHSLKNEIKNNNLPIIICGDFNTWNRKRKVILNDFINDLQLQKIKYKDKNLKKFLWFELDHILYKDLVLDEAKVLDVKEYSDHNPLIASFKIQL